eukprot:TRINITY_DN19404_c0_g1_i1.p1 TRINITY_DN19404_c0_g1~~TRINITY_DN19404_c0_g1_i1.p1  ORF type:complete len:573 (+),score=112.34 TRINITY_DN19404_c0_g1_i1:86-1804(+)
MPVSVASPRMLPQGSVLVGDLGYRLQARGQLRAAVRAQEGAEDAPEVGPPCSLVRRFESGERFTFRPPAAFSSVPELVREVLSLLPPPLTARIGLVCRLWWDVVGDILCAAAAAETGAPTSGRSAGWLLPRKTRSTMVADSLSAQRSISIKVSCRPFVFRIAPRYGPFAGRRLSFTGEEDCVLLEQSVRHPCGRSHSSGTLFSLARAGARPGREQSYAVIRRRLVALMHWNPLVPAVEGVAGRCGPFAAAGQQACGADFYSSQRSPGAQPREAPYESRRVRFRLRSGVEHTLFLPAGVCAAEAKWALRECELGWAPGDAPVLLIFLANGVVLEDAEVVPDEVDVVAVAEQQPTTGVHPAVRRSSGPRRSLVRVEVIALDVGAAPLTVEHCCSWRHLRSLILAALSLPQTALVIPQTRPGGLLEIRSKETVAVHAPQLVRDGAALPVVVAVGVVRVRLLAMHISAAIEVPAHPSMRFATLRQLTAAACARLRLCQLQGADPPAWCRVCGNAAGRHPLPTAAAVLAAGAFAPDGGDGPGPAVGESERLRPLWEALSGGQVLMLHVALWEDWQAD